MNNWLNNSIALSSLSAEIFLSLVILVQLLFNVFLKNSKTQFYFNNNTMVFTQTCFVFFFLLFLLLTCHLDFSFSNNIFYSTKETQILKILLIFFSFLAFNPIYQGFFIQKLDLMEFYTLFLFSILSGLLLISAGHFISIYLLIEMQALCFYILVCFKRKSVFSVEASIKYFVFGAIVSGILLFGISLLYGALGTLNLNHINSLLFSFPFEEKFFNLNITVIVGLSLICIALLFKLGIVPFHFWVPDVYEGAPISTTIILSYLPKIVFFNLFLKLFYTFGEAFQLILPLFLITGLLSASVGAFIALRQVRIKRFLIYSSISQMGFPIIVLSSTNSEALFSLYFFVILYTINSILMWTFYIFLLDFSKKTNKFSIDFVRNPLHLSDFSNLFKIDKRWSLLFVFALFSSAGLPPFTGFLSKFFIILQLAINHDYISAIVLLFIASISTFYYVRIIKIAFFEKSNLIDKNDIFSVFINDYFYTYSNLIFLSTIFLITSSFFLMDFWLNASQRIHLSIHF